MGDDEFKRMMQKVDVQMIAKQDQRIAATAAWLLSDSRNIFNIRQLLNDSDGPLAEFAEIGLAHVLMVKAGIGVGA